jgi:hypothetical protein
MKSGAVKKLYIAINSYGFELVNFKNYTGHMMSSDRKTMNGEFVNITYIIKGHAVA